MGIQIVDFLNNFAPIPGTTENLIFGMHLPVLWTVTIDGMSVDEINLQIEKARHEWSANISPIDMTTAEGNILVAQSVTLPTESSGFSPMNMGNAMGGFLPGYAMDARSNFLERSFSINFIETQTDIIHEFFRPWMIAVGIKGLIENGPSIKSTIEVRQWSNRQEMLRGYRFIKAFPTAVEGFTYDYANTDFPIKSVTFACQDYQQIIPEGTVTMGTLEQVPLGTPEVDTSSGK